MSDHWIAEHMKGFDASGIRKVFELGATLTDRIDLSIGQPHFDVPEEVRQAAVAAINGGRNGYALSQGMPELREKLQARINKQYGHDDREVFVTNGTSGGLTLAMFSLLNRGEEVIVFDPCFVMYNALATVAGAKVVQIDSDANFQVDLNRVADAITPKTKMIIFNSPCNPTGAMASRETIRQLAELATERDVVLVSDEIYNEFCYDEPFCSPAEFNPQTLVVDGFSKTYGMPGWRVGFAHGPKAIVQQMIKLQQYSFVCAPHPLQVACATAMDVDTKPYIDDYHHKRDLLVEGLKDYYEIVIPGGAFYAFPKLPWGSGLEFVTRAIEKYHLLVIPGNIFSRRDTHFRVSYAASDEVLQRGIEALKGLAQERP